MNKLLAIILLFTVRCNEPTKIDYYLPENFEGEVAIIHDINNGLTPAVKDGRLQIIIPDFGIVLLTNSYKPGKIDYRYFIKVGNEYSRLYQDNYTVVPTTTPKKIFMERVMTFDLPYKGTIKDSASFIGELFYVGKDLDTAVERKRFLFEKQLFDMLRDRK